MNNPFEFLPVIRDIEDWFKATFPGLPINIQALKIGGEMIEVAKETTLEGKRREAVDVFIAYIGMSTIDHYSQAGSTALLVATMFNLTPAMIREKLEINKKRTWVKDENGVPQHVE